MKKELAEALVIRRKVTILNYAKGIGNVYEACREFGVPRSSFYRWKKAYESEGIEGLIRKKPVARSHPKQIPPEYVEKILHLRTKYHLGPQRIAWYIERYHGFKTSCSSVYRTLKRNGIGPLPRNVGRRHRSGETTGQNVAGGANPKGIGSHLPILDYVGNVQDAGLR